MKNNVLEVQATGKYSKEEGGKVKIEGLSSIQYDAVMALVRSWSKCRKED